MLLEDRLAQIVPTLNPIQVQFALRFASGPAKHFAPDEKLLDVGDRNMAVWLVIEGSIVASRRVVWAASGYLPPAVQASSAER
jgi:thioredoxin reductase (NADPH)